MKKGIDDEIKIEELSDDEVQKQLINLTTFDSRIARADHSEDPLKAYERIYALLRISCKETAKNAYIVVGPDASILSTKKILKVDEIITYLDKNKGGLEELKTAVSVLKSTEDLLMDLKTPGDYKQEALKFQQTSHKTLGALMMALGTIMLAVGIGLSATGVATGAGIGLAIVGGGLACNGHRLFKAGKKIEELHKNMTDFVDLYGPPSPKGQTS